MNRRFSPRVLACVTALLLLVAGSAFAQFQTGNIFGKVVDSQGAALPGVTVTLSGVGAPQVFVTDNEGKFRFLSLSPGSYTLSGELSGFGKVVRSNVPVNVARNSEVTLTLSPAVEQVITVTAETPLLDVRKAGTGADLTKVELEQVPTARDPWVVLQQVPGVLIDRINVGGNESGQQSQYAGKGVTGDQATWNVDGVNITDMAALGSSPTYYDFDSFEEMQVTTGGSDPRIQTAGVQLNMVTKRGTNDFRGSARYYTDRGAWQATASIPTEAQGYLARVDQIDKIEDRGIEVGGPVWRDHLWFWGAYAQNDIHKFASESTGVAARGGIPPQTITLKDWNAKLNAQVTSSNSATFLFTRGAKTFISRNAGPSNAPEATYDQGGPTNMYKLEDTQIFGPNLYLTGLFSKVKGGFFFIPEGGFDTTAWYDLSQGVWFGTFFSYDTERPQDNYRLDGSTFFDTGVANNELKFGFGYRKTPVSSISAWPQQQYVQVDPATNQGYAYLFRPSDSRQDLKYTDVYAGDTVLLGNLTVQAGLRYDLQKGKNLASSVIANPDFPDLLPAVSFPGDTRYLEWKSVSPRLGLTYALGSVHKTLLRGAYNRYAGQLGAGDVALGHPFAVYQYEGFYFSDLNANKHADPGEVDFATGPLSWYQLDPNNPGSNVSPTRIDYGMSVPKTDEFIAGFEHELMPTFTLGVNYTRRKMKDFDFVRAEKTQGAGDFYTAADYELATTFTGTLPNGDSYSVPVYDLKDGIAAPVFKVVTTRPDYSQSYSGLEFDATKRMSNNWMLRGNLSLNDWKQSVGPDASADPTHLLTSQGCSNCDNAQVVQGSGTTSGAKGFVYLNSKWSANITGLYQFPWQLTAGASFTTRQGYPVPYYRRFSGNEGAKNVLVVDKVEQVRLDNIKELDLRLGKDFRFPGGLNLNVGIDAFNILNSRPVLQRRTRVNRSDTNRIAEIQSPRIFRIGARLSF